jgi:C_GCAxxG_C_C family probable redox protein
MKKSKARDQRKVYMNTTTPDDAEKQALAKKVQQTLKKSKNCAQTSFSALDRTFKLDGGPILKALTPFPGIALRGETCGAVTGCLMAIGLVYGREDLEDWKGYLASLPPCRRFCRRFEEEYTSLDCAGILEKEMGHKYDLADRTDAWKYALAGGQKTCGNIISNAVQIAAEIIQRKQPTH